MTNFKLKTSFQSIDIKENNNNKAADKCSLKFGVKDFLIYPKYLNTLISYHIHSEVRTSPFYNMLCV